MMESTVNAELYKRDIPDEVLERRADITVEEKRIEITVHGSTWNVAYREARPSSAPESKGVLKKSSGPETYGAPKNPSALESHGAPKNLSTQKSHGTNRTPQVARNFQKAGTVSARTGNLRVRGSTAACLTSPRPPLHIMAVGRPRCSLSSRGSRASRPGLGCTRCGGW